MGMFLDDTTTKRPPISMLAVMSLIIAATGFINVVGFLIGPVLAYVALVRLRGTEIRGRGMAIAALWVSYVSLIAGIVTLLVIVVVAYAALPSPPISLNWGNLP